MLVNSFLLWQLSSLSFQQYRGINQNLPNLCQRLLNPHVLQRIHLVLLQLYFRSAVRYLTRELLEFYFVGVRDIFGGSYRKISVTSNIRKISTADIEDIAYEL